MIDIKAQVNLGHNESGVAHRVKIDTLEDPENILDQTGYMGYSRFMNIQEHCSHWTVIQVC